MSNANQLTKKQLPFISSPTKENSNKVRALGWIFYSALVSTICPTLFVHCKRKKKRKKPDKILRRNIALTVPALKSNNH